MNEFVTIALALLLFISLGFNGFFMSEFLKKFRYLELFSRNNDRVLEWTHVGNHEHSGMRNIVIRGKSPFRVLIGFDLLIP